MLQVPNGGSGLKRTTLSVPDNLSGIGSTAAPAPAGLPTQHGSYSELTRLEQQRLITRLGDWVPSQRASDENYHRLSSKDLVGGPKVCGAIICSLLTRARNSVPILEWLPKYDVKASLFTDIVAGTTLALICVVQTLAHANIASTEVIQGPYCAFVPPFVYALLGTSRHASISSGAIVAILLADQLAYFHLIENRTQLASLLAAISGAMLVLMGLCRAAFAVRFLSQSLISGFVTGGSVLIMQGQLKNLCGMKLPHVMGFFNTAFEMARHLHTINWVGLSFGILQIICLNLIVRLKRSANARIKGAGPGPKPKLMVALKMLGEMKELVIVAMGILFAVGTLDENGEAILPVVGKIPQGLPTFRVPWDTPAVERLMYRSPHRQHEFFLGGALLALTSFLSTYATAKKQAMVHNYRIDASQEIFALGMAGLAGSCFQSFTPSGSLSRTSLASEMGVKSQLNGIMTTVVIGTVLMYLTPLLYYLPNATLGAIILKSSWNLLDFETAKDLWRSWLPFRGGGQKRDLVVWCIAFLLTICLGALYGIACAVLVAIGLIVYDAATPRAVTLGCVESIGNIWRDVEVWQGKTYPGLLVVEFRGPLFFASAEWFQDELEKKVITSKTPVKVIVLNFGSVHDLDPTALSMLKELLSTWRKLDISCIIADAKSRVRLLLERNFAGGKAPLLRQPAFIISLDDAVNLALRDLDRAGLRKPSMKATTYEVPWNRGKVTTRFSNAEPHVI
mmetsp:Transcript_107679/g.332653  ORF Transcript_107679/g.332653 Transcript_107679/m.332653 type:complete len:736 (+) Transcript_107679:47-2254(+)